METGNLKLWLKDQSWELTISYPDELDKKYKGYDIYDLGDHIGWSQFDIIFWSLRTTQIMQEYDEFNQELKEYQEWSWEIQ